MTALPVFCRWAFAPLIVAVAAAAGELCFLTLNTLESEPVPDLDYWFYTYLFAAIGAVTGAAGWYLARLSARRHTSTSSVGRLLLIPYLFVLLLALDKNPAIAVMATAAFGFIFGLAWLGHRATSRSRDQAK